ncbi:ABC transporter ATP-binding protein [Devosia sp. Root413D1]|jgi:multiple sugar transport system ATP-binding protein|uniref:ABC transporter ATP-binding protein n=1 Tax=unclassified Devosia TaxID=196773 RepID=UPI0006FBB1E2|nr:ABC transporter ATP-binding protein [Devosia sp. Root413D1]KQW75864.1 ABC transporter ATP-binding protein [Devosia sp. Root413D1]
MARIRLDKVSKRFGVHTAVSDLSIDVADGEFFVLLGPTGAGKTTTLRMIAGLEKPSAGSIYIDDENVDAWGPAERDVALVLQQYSLYPRLSVRENLAFPLRSNVRKMSQPDIDKRIDYASKTLRITHLLDRKTDRLSGGEMQRVSIGRAIVREPKVFLMDEPLSALDAKLREALRSELKDLQMRLGATFIFVTHDQVEAMTMGDRIAVLNKGRIVQVGTPRDVYTNPRDTFVASFVGSPAINLLPGSLAGDVASVAQAFEMPITRSAAVEGPVTFGIRPEDVEVTAGAPNEARIHDVENHGIEKIVTLRVGENLMRAAVPARVEVKVEEAVRFSWNPDKVMLFDAKTGLNLRGQAA